MHLYVVASGLPELDQGALTRALVAHAKDFALDRDTAWSVRSARDRIRAAGVHHAPERCGARRYFSVDPASAAWFDGLPVRAGGGADPRDAAALARHWDSLVGALEGQFSAVRVDLAAERAELQTDALGMNEVFYARRGRGLLLSNSASLIASLLHLHSPDPLGVSSFLALGWAVGSRTLAREVEVLAGGTRYVIGDGALQASCAFGPATIPRGSRARSRSADELADELAQLTASAVDGTGEVGCALTAGRDTRVLAALLQTTDADVRYFTGGAEDVPDVVIARELAQKLGVRHEVVTHDPASRRVDWTRAAAQFVRQNDGLSSLLQLHDYVDMDTARPLGVKLTGVGGEIGRAGTGALTAIATNMPVLRRSARVQRGLLSMKVRNEAGLMTTDALALAHRFLGDFRRDRLAEGWRPEQLQEAFYTFERVGRWAATGVRRVAVTDDVFSPFCSRPFIDYCFALRSAERYIEAAHYRLLGELSPELRDHRFEVPFRPQHASLVPALASGEAVGLAWGRVRRRMPARRVDADAPEPPHATYPFQHAWFEGRLSLIRELFSTGDSELWSFVSRPRLEALLHGEESERARHQEDLLRATTVFWHFHGDADWRSPAPSTAPPVSAPLPASVPSTPPLGP